MEYIKLINQTIRLLHHPTSQPCRAVQQLLLENNIPYEEEIVDLLSGDNEQQSFKNKYNPSGQVPILCDGNFVVWESAAIAGYLNEKYQLPANWFGSTLQQRALIQQYLHWHSTTLRRGAGAFFYTHFAECIWGNRDYAKEIEKGHHILYESLEIMESWLSKHIYLCGEEISFADLMGYHELVSHVAGEILTDTDWQKFSRVKCWYDKLSIRPNAKTVNQMIIQVCQMRLAGNLIPMTRKTSLAKGTEIIPGGIPH